MSDWWVIGGSLGLIAGIILAELLEVGFYTSGLLVGVSAALGILVWEFSPLPSENSPLTGSRGGGSWGFER